MANLGYLQLKVSFRKWNIFVMSSDDLSVKTGNKIRVADSHHFNADPDPDLLFNVDPDTAFN
jgi:hypothetical protein